MEGIKRHVEVSLYALPGLLCPYAHLRGPVIPSAFHLSAPECLGHLVMSSDPNSVLRLWGPGLVDNPERPFEVVSTHFCWEGC